MRKRKRYGFRFFYTSPYFKIRNILNMQDLYLMFVGWILFVVVAYIRADPRKKE